MKLIIQFLCLALLWGIVGYIVIYVDPDLLRDVALSGAYLPIFVPLSLALWYTGYLMLKNGWAALTVTIFVILGISLSMMSLMNYLIALTLFGIIIFSLYLFKSH